MLLILLLSLFLPTPPAEAFPELAKWSPVNIPTEGDPGSWVLASGSDVEYPTLAADGTIYCHANPSGTVYTLFKSTNGGFSWSYTGKVKDNIVDIAIVAGNSSNIYYATSSAVYKSTDSGNTFVSLPPRPGGTGADNKTITSMAVFRLEGSNIVAVGTKDSDAGQFGGVYLLEEKTVMSGWADTAIGNYDVLAVAFSPSYATDRQLVAVTTNETDSFVISTVNNGGWGTRIGQAIIKNVVAVSADIVFPDDYNATSGDSVLFIAISSGSGKGDVYKISGAFTPINSAATDLDIGITYSLSGVDVTSLAFSGKTLTGRLLAGAASSAQVYFSTDGGKTWKRSTKPPTGQTKTYVLMMPDFTNKGQACTATSGSESAFSITQDGGTTWNQVGLVDTTMSSMVEMAASPDYLQDNTLFLLTSGGKHSLWRSSNGSAAWERVFSGALTSVDSLKLVKLPPQYSRSSPAVILFGVSNGVSAIWKSVDNGQDFRLRILADPAGGAALTITVAAAASSDILFIGSYDGSNGLVYRSKDGGLTLSNSGSVGSQPLKSIALSPNYEQDKTVLTGNQNDGMVYWSHDDGATFGRLGDPLPQLITGVGVINDVVVAFDTKFATNKTVYTASHCSKGTSHSSAIYRVIIGSSTGWEKIDSTLPDASILNQLAVAGDGTLYSASTKADGGMERCLDPTYPLGPTFETVTRGLSSNATLTGLWLSGNALWSVDTKNSKLMAYVDSLTQSVTLESPPDHAPGIGRIVNDTISGVGLDWKELPGATSYRWQLNYRPNFATVPDGFEDETESSSAHLPPLEPATTYYWRVRATAPVLSPWSATWSFTTSLGTKATSLKLASPSAGASGIPIKPIFQWSPISDADKYELLVDMEASFAHPVIIKTGDQALPGTAWQCNVALKYYSTYYWKVRAGSATTWSAWSSVGAFITEADPALAPLPPPTYIMPNFPLPLPNASPPTPVPSTTPATPEWIIYLIGALLLIIILLVITMLVLVVTIRRH